MTGVDAIASRVAGRFRMAEAALFGRGRSGLAAVAEVLGLGFGSWVVVPATICPSVIAAARSRGLEVALADVDPLTGLPPDGAMAEVVASCPGRGIAMPTLLYGFHQRYPRTVEAARNRGWFILASDTCGVRAALAETDAPEADAVLVSFGAGKVIDAGGGGAVLTHDSKFAAALRNRAAAYPQPSRRDDDLEAWLTAVRRMLRNGPPGGPGLPGHYEALLGLDATQVCFAFDPARADALDSAIDGLDDEMARRRDQRDRWSEHLAPLGGRIAASTLSQEAPWRFVARLPQRRDDVLRALRAAGIDAGSNYPPVSIFFPVLLGRWRTLGAVTWGDEVFNLWLDERYGPDLMAKTAGIIAETLGA